MKIQILWLMLLLLFLSSCEETTDWELEAGENGALAVDAVITDEWQHQEIQLTLTYDAFNGTATGASDAQVSIIGENIEVSFLEDPDQPGRYISEIPFAAEVLKPYQLQINWQGVVYEGISGAPPVVPSVPVQVNQVGTSDSFTIRDVAPLYLPNQQAMHEVDIDWSHLVPGDSSYAKLFYYTFNTIDVNELFPPPKEKVYFPKGSFVIRKKYSLNNEFAAYLRALLMETEWQGGVFDEMSGSLPTNMSNGAVGFFGVSAIWRDTLIVL